MFTFDLNEALRFQNGQGVAEMLGISLDPEISIQTYRDHVSIRGVIELSGEYLASEADQTDENLALEDIDQRDFPSERYINEIEAEEDGVHSFQHHFPVEISIPNERIETLDDIFVGVDSFDYQLPEQSKMILRAQVAIHGLKDERELDGEEEEVSETQEYVTSGQSNVFDFSEEEEEESDNTFRFDVKETGQEQANEIDQEYEEEPEQTAISTDATLIKEKKERLVDQDNEESRSITSLFDRDEATVQSKLPEQSKEEAAQHSNPDEELLLARESDLELEGEMNTQLSPKLDIKHDDHQDVIINETSDHPHDTEDTERDTSYLLDIFGNDQEDTKFTSLKVYIVQDTDTLDTIAEKYQVSRSAVAQVNALDGDSIKSGQLVYIPNKTKS